MKCSVEDCQRNSYCIGLCGMHYKRKWRHNNVDYTERPINPLYKQKCRAYECDNLVGRNGAQGLCPTHYNRFYKYNRFHRVIAPKGSGSISSQNYVIIWIDDKPMYEHIYLAEKALGKKLPVGACVHHMNRNRQDNHTPFNLVICPDQSYHMLLHMRMRNLEGPWKTMRKVETIKRDE